MKVYKEVTCANDFDFWSGGRDTANYLTDSEIEKVISWLDEDNMGDGMSDTDLNDFFWYEDDTIAEWLGWPDFSTMMKARSGDNWFETYEDYEEYLEEEEDEEEEEEEDEDEEDEE